MKTTSCLKDIFLAVIFSAVICPLSTLAGDAFPHPDTYLPSWQQIDKAKKITENRSWYDAFPYEKVLPPELYKAITYDPKEMGTLWEEIIGFKAPDVVGKIAPEILPGHYTYKDLETKPGLKELLIPDLVENHIKPGGPPHSANIPEFDIIPTRQYYAAIPVAEATKKNAGKTKQDDDGYLMVDSWESGYPFPKPEGEFKAQQYVYNHERSYWMWGVNYVQWPVSLGFTKDLKIDFDSITTINALRLSGRVYREPYGFIDNRAADRKETHVVGSFTSTPRDIAGMLTYQLYFLDPETYTQQMLYIPSIRRVRVMSTTDSQDPIQGQDITYDDGYGISQKLTKTNFPWKYKVVEEREYLIPVSTLGNEYVDKEDGFALKNVTMERRPIAVIELEQMDSGYVYSKRVLYIDRETFRILVALSYDQKGRLYRTYYMANHFHPEFGTTTNDLSLYRDYVDLHSSLSMYLCYPAFYNRIDSGYKALADRAK